MHTIREITRLATMLAGLIAHQLRLGFVSATPRLCIGYTSTTPHLRLDYALASISCEHCCSSRNNPHCAPRHVIYYSYPNKNRNIWLDQPRFRWINQRIFFVKAKIVCFDTIFSNSNHLNKFQKIPFIFIK